VSAAEPPLVQVSTLAGVRRLVLDSPANRNALSARLRRELTAGLRAAFADPEVRAVLLSHAGTVFCSGADLREATSPPPPHPDDAGLPEILQLLLEAPKPVVARVAGKARAGGIGLVAACQVAVGSTAADFALSEVRLGVVPALISAPLLRVLRPRDAEELLLTAEVFGAERAVAAGLLTRAVAPEELDAETDRVLAALSHGAPGAVAATLRLLRRDGLTVDWDLLESLSAHHFASEEAREGILAWTEHRPPAWVPS
jgi:methylglutaconyl-CoA hydratase